MHAIRLPNFVQNTSHGRRSRIRYNVKNERPPPISQPTSMCASHGNPIIQEVKQTGVNPLSTQRLAHKQQHLCSQHGLICPNDMVQSRWGRSPTRQTGFVLSDHNHQNSYARSRRLWPLDMAQRSLYPYLGRWASLYQTRLASPSLLDTCLFRNCCCPL